MINNIFTAYSHLNKSTDIDKLHDQLANMSNEELTKIILDQRVKGALEHARELTNNFSDEDLIKLLSMTEYTVLLCIHSDYDEDHFIAASAEEAQREYDRYNCPVAMCDLKDEHSRKRGVDSVIHSVRQNNTDRTCTEVTDKLTTELHEELAAAVSLAAVNHTSYDDAFVRALLDTAAAYVLI